MQKEYKRQQLLATIESEWETTNQLYRQTEVGCKYFTIPIGLSPRAKFEAIQAEQQRIRKDYLHAYPCANDIRVIVNFAKAKEKIYNEGIPVKKGEIVFSALSGEENAVQ
jgi:hypothetical protein